LCINRAVRRGKLLTDRDSEGATIFRHADGTAYGSPMAPRVVDAQAEVSALRHIGFREGEVKTVLAELRCDAELHGRASNTCSAKLSAESGRRRGEDATEHPTRRRLASEDGSHEVMRIRPVVTRAAL
jgi:hypothetical protein